MSAVFWVVGGKYTDTQFTEAIGRELRHGPFKDYEDAKKEWARLAWQTIDDATVRYRIEQAEDVTRVARYYVVGGAYKSTRFDEPVGPNGEEWIGPFPDYEKAKAEWARKAWQTVDEANTRYRIEKRYEAAEGGG